MDIRIGTSGYSYNDWRRVFYPAGLKAADMLAYYAQRFPAVEINTTYYRPPTAAVLARMAAKVPAGFEFAVKAHKLITHGESFAPDACSAFHCALAPLREAGSLGAVLAQFPSSFHRTPQNEEFLARLRDALPEDPLVVEFRHHGWVTDATWELLRSLDIGYCCVDEPALRGLVPPVARVTSAVGYVRFHGRNAAEWWKHEHGWQRYNYLYSEAELAEWVPRVEEVASRAAKTYVFFNNHYIGQAGQNARMLAELLRVPLREPPPAEPSDGPGVLTLPLDF